MENRKIIHGFEFISEVNVPEIDGILREAVYKKNGAKLLFIDRKDSNKTFSIAFKTIPEDSTGVFHILEHSVLCGSDKYPVKEPFVELLKSSVKTFLNAFTFPDKTMYPVSSRNDKDFLNLIDVYMDAVLHPLALTKPEIFSQEGWHYELHEGEDALQYKGVVFNEMKGAYSSADEVMMETVSSMLYSGTTYAKDSGGDPLHIPDLTYEKFVASHKKFYHPSNARIILDGSVDLDSTLKLLDDYLSKYDYLDMDTDIPRVQPIGRQERRINYEIAPSEDPKGKCRICLGFKASSFEERRKIMALGVISDAIAGSNESPFKKAMLDSDICEDVNIIAYDGIQENSLLIEIKNVDEERIAEAESLAIATIEKIVKDGIDRKLLLATFNSFEFKLREQDMATYPRGIAYAITAYDTWLYGGNAKDALSFEDDIAYLRSAIDTDYYEKMLSEIILESKHSAALYMIPSPTLGQERAEAERKKLAEIYNGMTEQMRAQVIKNTEVIENWQKSPDTKEALSTLPMLSLSDLDSNVEPYPSEAFSVNETETVYTSVASRGITYTNLLFDISDLNENELFLVSLLCELYKNLPTEKYDALGLQTLIKTELGTLAVVPLTVSSDGEVKSYVNVSVSSLNSRLFAVADILSELLLTTDFSSLSTIGKIVRQIKCDEAESIGASGHAVAMSRSMAYISREAAVSEYLSGLEHYIRLKELDSEFDLRKESLSTSFAELQARIFTKKRLKVFYAGERNDLYAKAITELFPIGEDFISECKIETLGIRHEGVLIPAGVAFAGKGVRPLCESAFLSGSWGVARTALSFGYLWNNIRVLGGAYGAGFAARRNSGNCGFYTYRDPSPHRSVEIFKQSPSYLKDLAASDEDIDGFIIGALGDSDPLMTPKVTALMALGAHLRHDTTEARQKHRSELLGTTKDDLLKISEWLEAAIDNSGVCIVGGRDKLDACGDIIDSIIEI